MRPCVALWQQPGGRGLADSRKRPLAAGYIRLSDKLLLGRALGSRRCRKRTPGPPPFSSMNSTPPTSKARRTAKSLATRRFSDFRFNYSVLGDTVNIASRLEARTKDPHCHHSSGTDKTQKKKFATMESDLDPGEREDLPSIDIGLSFNRIVAPSVAPSSSAAHLGHRHSRR